MVNRVLVVESFCNGDEQIGSYKCISEASSKGMLISYGEVSRVEAKMPCWTEISAHSRLWAVVDDHTRASTLSEEIPIDAIFVRMYTFPYDAASVALLNALEQRSKVAMAYGAQPTYLDENRPPKFISIFEMVGGARVRHDNIASYNGEEIIKRSAMGVIKREQFLMEINYIIDPLSTKYGA